MVCFRTPRRAGIHAVAAGRRGDVEIDVGFLIGRAVIDAEGPLARPEIAQGEAHALGDTRAGLGGGVLGLVLLSQASDCFVPFMNGPPFEL